MGESHAKRCEELRKPQFTGYRRPSKPRSAPAPRFVALILAPVAVFSCPLLNAAMCLSASYHLR